MNSKEYLSLKKVLDKLKSKREQLVGAIQQTEKRLKEEFGCNSLKEAETLLKKLEKERVSKEEKFIRKLTEFVTANRESLEELDSNDYQVLRSFVRKQAKTKKRKEGKAKSRKRTKKH